MNEPIWKFIAGNETRYLYELCLAKVRAQQQPMILPFRCDAPDRRRYLELKMTPLAREQVAFASRILREEPREKVQLLQHDVARSEAMIKMCSMCKKVELSKDVWLEVEDAITVMELFLRRKCCRRLPTAAASPVTTSPWRRSRNSRPVPHGLRFTHLSPAKKNPRFVKSGGFLYGPTLPRGRAGLFVERYDLSTGRSRSTARWSGSGGNPCHPCCC